MSHYVNNEEFLKALVEYRQQVTEAVAAGKEKPGISNYIGECILKIARHLSYKSNFINYSFKDEMISDGVENCLMYIDNFDPAKSSNPFSYFTQIVYFAFIRRIQKEGKQSTIKGKLILDLPPDFIESLGYEDDAIASGYMALLQSQSSFVEAAAKDDQRKAKAKQKRKATLDDIIE